jgi:ABC-type bacteriocin/lantibiotic exporters, contain an N-terminal double-glycine peptidase domain
MDFYVPAELVSREALRFAFVREQGYDKSCGYSAAASLLSLYWRLPVDEEALLARYANEKVESGKLEVSLDELFRIFRDYGFAVKGVRMNWDQLADALERFAPIVIHYARPDRHFALALHARDGWVITLDPALGCEILSREQFLYRWSGAALIAFSNERPRDDALVEKARASAWDRRDLLERLGE